MVEYADYILSPVWGWDGTAYFDVAFENPDAQDPDGTVWHEPNVLKKGHGYWIYVAADGTIIIP
jgi:hypothetical protein